MNSKNCPVCGVTYFKRCRVIDPLTLIGGKTGVYKIGEPTLIETTCINDHIFEWVYNEVIDEVDKNRG